MNASQLIELKQSGRSFDSILHLLQKPEVSEDTPFNEDEVEFIESAAQNIHEVCDRMEVAFSSGDFAEAIRLSESLSDTFEMIKDMVNEARSRFD
ncbi:MAG: hypothetical protein MJA83_16570 [Gammaproteobacteria bacterium]|nr:hypothetical protein [Gammaproteobacteria bacterium]